MPLTLKSKIQMAAEIQRRKMADWARLELERAADAVLDAYASRSAAVPADPIPLVPLSALASPGSTHPRATAGLVVKGPKKMEKAKAG